MTRRAESQAQTRLRITESAVALHGTLGPSRTSMSAIAEHAGVPRSTLYRHFPDEVAVFQACSRHWSAANPPPDLSAWAAIGDPDARLRTALDELYAYYERNAQMLANLVRDEPLMDVVRERFAAFRGFLDAAAGVLMDGRRLRGARRRRARAAIGHVLAFTTWTSLTSAQSLPRADAVALACRMVSGD